MKLSKILLIITIVTTGIFTSCVDSDYHWDNINGEGILNVPPVPLGSFDKMEFMNLRLDIEDLVDDPDNFKFKAQLSDTLKNIFGENAVKDFFYKDMKRDLSIEGDFDLSMEQDVSNWKVNLAFDVLNENDKIIEQVKIQGISGIKNGKQDIKIIFPKELGDYMQNANSLKITLEFYIPTRIDISADEYMQLSNLIIKTAGYFVDL